MEGAINIKSKLKIILGFSSIVFSSCAHTTVSEDVTKTEESAEAVTEVLEREITPLNSCLNHSRGYVSANPAGPIGPGGPNDNHFNAVYASGSNNPAAVIVCAVRSRVGLKRSASLRVKLNGSSRKYVVKENECKAFSGNKIEVASSTFFDVGAEYCVVGFN